VIDKALKLEVLVKVPGKARDAVKSWMSVTAKLLDVPLWWQDRL